MHARAAPPFLQFHAGHVDHLSQDVDLHEHASSDDFFDVAEDQFDLLVGFSAPHRFGVQALPEFTGIGDTLYSGGSVCLVLGSETHGMEFLTDEQRNKLSLVYLPISPAVRSLNLATCAGVALYEAARQGGFTQAELESAAEAESLRAPRGRWEGTGPEHHR